MISVNDAKACITANIVIPSSLQLPLIEAAGLVLAKNVYAIRDIPGFEQSSMDGYAIRFEDKEQPLLINGEMAAGSEEHLKLKRGQAVRIFTGAPLPEGADTVVMQEKTAVEKGELRVLDQLLQKGGNVRNKGAEIRSGSLAMEKGSFLSPGAIGFLAGIGLTEVFVYPLPAVTIIVTGRELQKPGNELQFGQVYESNSYSLRAALREAHIKEINVFESDDDLIILKSVLDKALDISDIVLLTGGVSVGDYDFVLEACALCGVDKLFHKVKQKPGKPLFFGKKDRKLVFGLPGNPSSVLTCFYEYVLPALETISARKDKSRTVTAVLQGPYSKASGLTHFLKGYVENGQVSPLNAQESFRLSSFAKANCLIQLEEDGTEFKIGDTVEVHLL